MILLVEIGIALFLVILTGIFIKNYLKILNARKKLCHWLQPAPRVPILGSVLEFRGGTVKLLDNLTRLTDNPAKSCYAEMLFDWAINTRDYDFLEFILSSNTITTKSTDYKYLTPWLGTGLITSAGSKWKSHRRIITPTFHFAILEKFMDIFNSNENLLIEILKGAAVKNESLDICKYITACALDIICESAMGVNIESQLNRNQDYSQAVRNMCQIMVDRVFSAWKRNDFLFKFSANYKKQCESLMTLHKFTNSVIEKRIDERKNSKLDVNQDDLGQKKKLAFLDSLLNATVDGKALSREEIREEVDTFMFAGHDTTSSAASFAFYFLSNDSQVQAKIRKELKQVVGKDRTKTLTLRNIQDLKYLDMVVKEVLRLFPPVSVVSRLVVENANYKGHVIPAGTVINLFIYGINRDPEYYRNPDAFRPERFQNFTGNNPFAYVPFSAGPRNCIGQKYALLEMKSMIAKVLMNFEILPTDPPHQIELANEVVLTSVNGVFIRLKEIDW